jgi:hypothetical protein
MGRMPKALTKRSTVWGLPIGRRRTDWAKLGRASMVGLSAISAVADLADGVRSARDGRAPEAQRRDDEAKQRDDDATPVASER